MRILVVDDSGFMRRALVRMITSEPGMRVVAEAKDGAEGLRLAKELAPDVVTLDVEMPGMDGLTALPKILSETACQVLMVSSLAKQGSREALKALALGAADFVTKDASHVRLQIDDIRDELIGKLKALGGSRQRRPGLAKPPALTAAEAVATARQPVRSRLALSASEFDLILVGSSTGGPPVLEAIVTRLPADMSAPVVIAQHMPPMFTAAMAGRFDAASAVTVVQAADGMPLYPGTVYIAPGGKQTHVKRAGGRFMVRVNEEPASALYKPSVDVLFSSAAQAGASARTLAVVLTGMGEDGLIGGRELKAGGAKLLAQDEATSVVYGMPKAITAAGLVEASLRPLEIAATLASLRTGAGGAAEKKAG